MILPPRESASRRCSGLQNARRLKQGIHSLGHRVSYASRSTFRKSSGFQLLQWNTAKNAKMDGWNTTDDRFGTTLKTSLLSSSIFAKVWFLYVFVGRLPWKSWSTCPTWPTYSSVAGVRAPGCRSGGRQCSRMPNHTPQLTLGLSPEPLSTFSRHDINASEWHWGTWLKHDETIWNRTWIFQNKLLRLRCCRERGYSKHLGPPLEQPPESW